jgi:hypothetical protein
MFYNSSRETQTQKCSSSIGSAQAHLEQNMKTSKVVMPHQLLEMFQYYQATNFIGFFDQGRVVVFLEYPHYGI